MTHYIKDCNGNIVGNPKGYKTIKSAIKQTEKVGSPAYNAIWNAYDAKYATMPPIEVTISSRELCKVTEDSNIRWTIGN